MKKLILTGMLLPLAIYAGAQGFAKAEYFFDTDPGIGNAIAIPLASINDTTSFTTTISTGALTPGFHFLGMRMQHNDDTWGLFESRGLYISSATNQAASIEAAEYFIDTDPGAGNGVPIPVTTGNTVGFTIPVSTSSLAVGFHFLAIRTRDADENWGLFESRGFYISGATANTSSIVAAEYFIDSDPGVGNGIAIVPITSGATVSFTIPVSTASLAAGFHFLAIRTRDADGNWGLFENRGFYISSATTDATAIVAAEYFIDTDPGAGNGLAVGIGAFGNTVSFVAPVPTGSLSIGFHFLAIRTKDAAGNWGLFENRGFYISPSTTDVTDIVSVEYFIDSDPGIGNGTPLAFSASGSTVSQSFICPTPAGISLGDHLLVIRALDVSGTWGLFELDTFTVGTILSANGLQLEARMVKSENRLSWSTETERNTSYFEVEKSRNGIGFSKIGEVTAAGKSFTHSDYQYIDKDPFNEMNYYRIRLVDKDGSSTYSNIATVMRPGRNNDLTVYPNPATTTINIAADLNSTYSIQLFGNAGQLLGSYYRSKTSTIGLDVSTLAAGKYYLRISDGIRISTAEFVKSNQN